MTTMGDEKTKTSRKSFVAGAVAAAASAPRIARAQAVALHAKCASSTPPGHPITVRATQMWRNVERETNGAVVVDFFPNNALGGDSSVISQARSGAIEFLLTPGGVLAQVVPLCGIENTAFAFKNAPAAWRTLDGPLGARIRADIAGSGLYAFDRVWDAGLRNVSSGTVVVRTPHDLRGFKIRTANARVLVDLFKTLEAVPTPIDLNEVYTALQTHVVDGTDNSLAGVETFRYFEVQRSISLTGHRLVRLLVARQRRRLAHSSIRRTRRHHTERGRVRADGAARQRTPQRRAGGQTRAARPVDRHDRSERVPRPAGAPLRALQERVRCGRMGRPREPSRPLELSAPSARPRNPAPCRASNPRLTSRLLDRTSST